MEWLEPESGCLRWGNLTKEWRAGRETAGQETSSHLITRDFFASFFYFPGALSRNTRTTVESRAREEGD